MQYVKIPGDRVGVLIGEKGETKRLIEKRTKTKIAVEDSEVSVEGESFREWIAKDVVKAIGRGFAPDKALLLLDEENTLEIIYVPDVVGGTDKNLERVRSRVIGTKGKTRKTIEKVTECLISIQGKTIAIIGPLESAALAKEAVVMIAAGSPHSRVYRFLERSRQGRIR